MEVYANVSHFAESLTAPVNRYRASPRQRSLCAALIECRLHPADAAPTSATGAPTRRGLPPMPSWFSQR
jgi:hypothetical protein